MTILLFLLGAAAGAAATLLYGRRRQRARDRQVRALSKADTGDVRSAGDPAELGAAAPQDREELRRALQAVSDRLGARRALLWHVSADGMAHCSAVTAGERPADVALEGNALGWALEQGMPLRFNTPQRWSRGGNGCAIPLRRTGTGALVTLEFAVEADLPEPESLGLWGSYLDAFARAEAYQTQAARDRERTDALLDVLRRLPASLDLEHFATELAEAARRLGEVDGAAVAMWDGTAGEVVAVASDGGAPPRGIRFGLAESVLGLVPRASGAAIREHRRTTGHRLPVLAPAERWAVEPRAAAAFPLRRADGAILAILGVWSTAEPTLDPRSLASIDTAVPYASLHLTQVKAYDRARDDSQRDALTGLLNRRGFEQQLAEEAARCARYGRPMAVAMLDIDHFKAINDSYGHDGGDAVLRALGQMLASTLRETDTPARLGGEEFVVLMPETPLDAATDTAERLRARLQALEIPWRGKNIPFTASFGVSAVPECVPSASILLTSADEALYASKHAGRNRVTAAVTARR